MEPLANAACDRERKHAELERVHPEHGLEGTEENRDVERVARRGRAAPFEKADVPGQRNVVAEHRIYEQQHTCGV